MTKPAEVEGGDEDPSSPAKEEMPMRSPSMKPSMLTLAGRGRNESEPARGMETGCKPRNNPTHARISVRARPRPALECCFRLRLCPDLRGDEPSLE